MINGLLAIVLNITLSITLSKFIGVVGVALATKRINVVCYSLAS